MANYKFQSGIPSDKEIKKIFKKWTDEKPEEFFPVGVLKELGYQRKKCRKCGKYFWEQPKRNRDYCGEPSCEGGYSFIGHVRKEDISFTEIWTMFESFFKKRGYKSIKRYPVIARWNPTVEFTIASITDFQPYVVSGEIPPPAELLVVPQLCLRFSDIDNVGITGRHYTGFTMIGQHAFLPKEEFDQDKYFKDYFQWFLEDMNLKKEELVIHEDSWGGGGNFGACLEFFSGGLELGNQVYPTHKVTKDGLEEMDLRVLDMGMGQERCVWFLRGSASSYEVVMPNAIKYLNEKTGFHPSSKEKEIIKKFLPFSGLLCNDELENPEMVWDDIAKNLGVKKEELKKVINKWSAINAIAEHSRSLVYALADSGLPSNVGGGYNLRTIFRRAMDFIERFGWKNVKLTELADIHANSLNEEYPELKKSIETVKKILKVEEDKYYQSLKKREKIIRRIIEECKKGNKLSNEDLIKYYDSFGITPSLMQERLKEEGTEIRIPDNFYSYISQMHDSKNKCKSTTKKELELDVPSLPATEKLYIKDYLKVEFRAMVLWAKDDYIVLNKTAFYPTSGGQMHDTGKIIDEKGNEYTIKEVIKHNNLIVHRVDDKKKIPLKKNDVVKGEINKERRIQLSQHHTSAHIVNGAARRILGEHVWQAGAAKSIKKGRLDITHYEGLSKEDIKRIEDLANQIIKEDRKVNNYILERGEAEERFGFRIYQGGAVPGVELRIVEIKDFDVEACGGTHLKSTGEAEIIKILKSTKIQDGVVRIEFAAGKAAKAIIEKEEKIINELKKLLNCNEEEIVGRIEELFKKWKKVRKALKKKKEIKKEWLVLESKEKSELNKEDILQRSAEILSTQPEHLTNTVSRFLNDLERAENE